MKITITKVILGFLDIVEIIFTFRAVFKEHMTQSLLVRKC